MSRFLIWSNERGRWLKPDYRGYTAVISEAGRYDYAFALGICKIGNADLMPDQRPRDVLVLAPECIDATHLRQASEQELPAV